MDLERITRESPLWFEDGNLVLTAAEVSFKVHRSVLERHSEIFRNAFGLPGPDNRSKLDAAPVIHLSDDPRDLGFFLLAVYDGLYFERHQASNFVIISGVLRLSIKYNVEHLRVECLNLLQHDWPMTLAGWDLREGEAMSCEGTYESTSIRPHPIYVINLANELGAAGATLLPAAYYDLSRYNCSSIWLCSAQSAVDLQAVMLGREASQSFMAHFLQRELEARDAALLCQHVAYQNGLVCRDAFDDLALELYRGLAGVTFGRDSDPLFTLNAAMIMQRRAEDGKIGIHTSSRACERCRAEFAKVAMNARRYVWDQLPCWFGLEAVLQGS